MINKIKYINMQDIFETLCDAEKGLTKEKERELEFICYGIEGKEDFNNLFFFTNKENYEYFYLESQESEIKEYLSQYINVNALENYRMDVFKDYIKELREIGMDEVIFKTSVDELIIDGEDVLELLEQRYLNYENEDIINRLIKAENFYDELCSLKEECLNSLIDMYIIEIRDQLKSFKF